MPWTVTSTVTSPNRREAGAFFQRRLEAHQHHVRAFRREAGGAAGRHLDLVDHLHGHDLAAGCGEVKLAPLGNLGRHRQQTIGFRTRVGDRKIERANLGAGCGGARPGVRNRQGAGRDLMGGRGRRDQNGAQRQGERAGKNKG
jgi:hypothetical protein